MAKTSTEFWKSLLFLDDYENRARLWNGYLGWKLPHYVREEKETEEGWPNLTVVPPDGGWPELTEEEKARIEKFAENFGGHPEFDKNYMDFTGIRFRGGTDFSGLIFVNSNFNGAHFGADISSFKEARFFGETNFNGAAFDIVQFYKTRFDAPVNFMSSRFKSGTSFNNVDFMGGASFINANFEGDVDFNASKFLDRYFSDTVTVYVLADFRNTKFMKRTSFRNVQFGNDNKTNSNKIWAERIADFTDAKFEATTDFRGAVFSGVPAFFNTTLHEDTDFSDIDWKKAETADISPDYAIRAWERLELMMSKLEKPFERHQFFRLKMRARRRTDNWFLRTLNCIFEVTSDYGWGVRRAFLWWFGHWFVMSFLLYLNAAKAAISEDWWKLSKAALGTGFANAHAFLGLATGEGYLASCKQDLMEISDSGFLNAIGTIEAFLGPIFLFLLLLTLRNRFRLA